MAHSKQVREFVITSKGIKLVEVYLGPGGVLTGSARLNQENREGAEKQAADDELARKKLALEHRRKVIEAQVETLRSELKIEEEEFLRVEASSRLRDKQLEADRQAMSASRR